MKFTDVGRIRLEASYEGRVLTIRAKDTGIGFPDDDDPNSWSNTFVQAVPGCDERGGTGLGLSLARSMLQVQSGQLDIRSIDDDSEFSTVVALSLPAEVVPQDRAVTKGVTDDSSPAFTGGFHERRSADREANTAVDLDEDRIREAALCADLDALSEILSQVKQHDQQLAEELAPLLASYDYQTFAQTLLARQVVVDG